MQVTLRITDRDAVAPYTNDGGVLTEVAAAAESAGFHAVSVPDHPFPPDAYDRIGGHHALDPLVALAFCAAATRTLRLRTNLFVLPYRNPFVAAKGIASLDALSRGRVILGIGAGYLRPEFDALGASFGDRNERLDEAIIAMKRAWTEDELVLDGTGYAANGNTMRPRPAQQPHPPIWIGGNSTRAMLRAVELGDGWVPFLAPASASARNRTASIADFDALAERVAQLRDLEREHGRPTPLPLCLPFPDLTTAADRLPSLVRDARTIAELGVTEVIVGASRTGTPEAILGEIARLGPQVVRALAEI